MPKLFQFFRRKSVNLGSLKKYLLYAIGEIILLVIGILIALQFNAWTKEKANRKLEQIYLLRFHEDLSADFELFKAEIDEGKGKINSMKQAIALLHGNNIEKDLYTLNDYYDNAWVVTPIPQNTTYRELESTGQMNLIQNRALRTAIMRLYASYEQMLIELDHLQIWRKNASLDMDSETSILKYTAFAREIFPAEHRAESDWSYLNDINHPSFKKTEVGFAALTFLINDAMIRYSALLPEIESLAADIDAELKQ